VETSNVKFEEGDRVEGKTDIDPRKINNLRWMEFLIFSPFAIQDMFNTIIFFIFYAQSEIL
jgi:hypothetical protein